MFAHNVCLQQEYQSWGEMGRMGPISVLATHGIVGNKLITTESLQFVNRNLRFDKFIKSVTYYWVSIDICV